MLDIFVGEELLNAVKGMLVIAVHPLNICDTFSALVKLYTDRSILFKEEQLRKSELKSVTFEVSQPSPYTIVSRLGQSENKPAIVVALAVLKVDKSISVIAVFENIFDNLVPLDTSIYSASIFASLVQLLNIA